MCVDHRHVHIDGPSRMPVMEALLLLMDELLYLQDILMMDSYGCVEVTLFIQEKPIIKQLF